MTTIDHQQAAKSAAAEKIIDAVTAFVRDHKPISGGQVAKEALTAATPHLRAAWAAELGATFQSGERWNETYRKGLRTLQYEKAYLDGAIDILALLEGGAE